MRITTVHYERLRSFGNYENETVGATAVVEDGEQAIEALVKLRNWVFTQLTLEGDVEGLSDRKAQLEWDVRQLENRLENAKRKYDAVKALLERHGVKIDDELPF